MALLSAPWIDVIYLKTKKETCISCGSAKIEWQSDVNGMPMLADIFGIKGFSKTENEIFLQSKYDVYVYDILAQNLQCLMKRKQEMTTAVPSLTTPFCRQVICK